MSHLPPFSKSTAAPRRLGWPLWLLVAALGVPRDAGAAPPAVRVTVQAQPRFESVRSQSLAPGMSELRAKLVEDTGSPMAGQSVTARAGRATSDLSLEPCGPAQGQRTTQRLELETGAGGDVCVRVKGAAPSGTIELAYGGDGLHLPANAQAPLESAPPPSRLAFDAPSIELDLDQREQRLRLHVSGLSERGDTEPRIQLSLQEGDRARRLEAESSLRQADGVVVTFRSDQLGPPGPARLIATLGSGSNSTALRAESVALKLTTVHLRAEVAAHEGERAVLQIEAAATGGPPTSGWVEAWLDGEVVASTPLGGGHASLELSALPAGAANVSLRYRPEEPWWLPGEPFELILERAIPRTPGRWPWLVLIAPIAWVCSRALQRPAPRDAAKKPRRRPPTRAKSLPAAAATPPGWTGQIVDAHDGAPIARAIVQISLPSLLVRDAGATTHSDERGFFALPALTRPLPEGARMRVSARLHTEVERPLPPEGRVDISMISRRRLLLRRLVRWARAMGTPWHRSGEPTPREIVNVALRRGEPQTARWAEAVESAAFGSIDVDMGLEAALRGQEPAWTQSSRAREDDLED